MAFTRIQIDNLFCFSDTVLNLTFTRPSANSSIEGEYIEGYERFYFKKVCILSGANASGKTSLGRVLFAVQQFLDRGVVDTSLLQITDKTRRAYVEVDFFQSHNSRLYRVGIELLDKDKKAIFVKNITICSIRLRKNDSCSTATKRLSEIWDAGQLCSSAKGIYYSSELLSQNEFSHCVLNENFFFGWHYVLSENQEVASKFSRVDKNVLSAILKTFDNTIKSVTELTTTTEDNEVETQGYSVSFNNNDKVIIDLEGDITNKERLSRGTYEAVKISHLLSGIITDAKEDDKIDYDEKGSATYFLDEKMAFTHTELEKMIITLMISKLCRYGQFFYTTHNYDILTLDLPVHTFTFTRKNNGITQFIDANETHKKNDRSLINYVRNDCFGTVPDVSLIEEIMFED